MTGRGLLVEPLLAEIDLDYEGLRVAAIGGGHGLAQALLAAQDYADVITAVVSVADDGGSSGRLAPGLGIPPPGDLRRALLALSPEPSLWRDLVGHRFEGSDVDGHSLGNLILAALSDLSGDFEEALATLGRLLGARGDVVPASPQPLALEATVDGVCVAGQVNIARSRGRIEDLRVVPRDAVASPAAVRALTAADQIVIGPGSLFTSLMAVLKVPGIVEAVNASPAAVVYVCNLATQDGETLGLDAVDHVRTLCGQAGMRLPDSVVLHDGMVEVPAPVEPIRPDRDAMASLGVRVEMADLVDPAAGWPRHHPVRLGGVLRRLA
jgi:uncharacterized cofD-like protein